MSLYEEIADEMLSTTGWQLAAANVAMPDRAGLVAKLRERWPDEEKFRAEMERVRAEAKAALDAAGPVVGVAFELPPGWTVPPKGAVKP